MVLNQALRSACASVLVCVFVYPLVAFVILCSAGLSAIEGLQPLGLVPETELHGLGLAWPQTSWTSLITAHGWGLQYCS